MRKMIFVVAMMMAMIMMTGCSDDGDSNVTDNAHVFTLDESGVTVYMNDAELKPIETETIEVEEIIVETIETETIEEGHKIINKGDKKVSKEYLEELNYNSQENEW